MTPDRRPADSPARRWVDDPRRVAVIACVLLVTLRLFIGWQLAYEGLWKVRTLDTPRPWTSEGYLANAQGPLRDTFRNMTGDPDDLGWLDYDTVNARWNDYYVRFLDHHPDLSDAQTRRLQELFVGPKDFRAAIGGLPEAPFEDRDKDDKVIASGIRTVQVPKGMRDFVQFNPQMQRIIVDGKRHLTAQEKTDLLALVGDVLLEEPEMNDAENYSNWELAKKYTEAIEQVYKRATRLSYRERLEVATKIDPAAPRVVFGNFRGSIGDEYTPIDSYYRVLLEEYDEAVETAETDYQREHAETLWGEIQELRQALSGPVKSLDAQLKADMWDILTPEQKARGPVPRPWDAVRISDTLTIVGLCTLGTLLIFGFLTRISAFAAGCMVLGFYLAWPPWPGVPEAPGPDHALVVNKNLIEVAALLVLAALPTGRWFGVDGALLWLWRRWTGRRHAAAAHDRPVPPEAIAEPSSERNKTRRDALGRETMPLSKDDAEPATANGKPVKT